jgi:hypothetical protein
VDYDPAIGGGSSGTNRNNDIPYWVRNGWKGLLRIVHTEPVCNDPNAINDTAVPAYAAPNCANSRLETLREVQGQGNLGNNIKDAARDYIDLHKAGNDPGLCRDRSGNSFTGTNADFADVTVFFWRFGEQDLPRSQTYGENNDSMDRYDQSRIWRNAQLDAEGDLKRIIVHRASNFRFCRGLVGPPGNGSAILGFFVAWVDFAQPPTNDPPNAVNNTVSLVE